MGNPLGWKGLTTWKAKIYVPVNPFPPMSVKWHLKILLCLMPDDFTRQWGTPYGGKG